MNRSHFSRSALALLVGFALASSACQTPEAEADATDAPVEEGRRVEVLVADPGFFEDAIELTGTVESPNDASLSPDVAGTLTYVAPVGTFVRRGGTVAQVKASLQRAGVAQAQAGTAQARAGIAQAEAGIAQADAGVKAAKAQREAAQAQLDLAQDQYERQAPLVRDSILSALEFRSVQTQLANARAGVAQADAGVAQAEGQLRAAREGLQAAQAQLTAANAGVQSARTQLGNTRITAPFSGVVEQRLAEPGELAAPGQPVVRLVASGTVKVVAGVPERYASEIENGTQVRIIPNAYGAEARGGRVTFVGSAINTQSRTFPIEIAVENADRTLKPEMVVRLELTRDVLRDVITVPQETIIRDERGTSVFVAEEGEAIRRIVELGPMSGDEIVILSGVEPGDQIIVSGQADLAQGDKVSVTETRSPSSPARDASASSAPASSETDDE
ncbi:MAG: efflux RND transporter periplasmic adaptor subunit [Bacteroidota bacterium]